MCMLCCVIHGYIIINLDDMSWYVPTTLYYEQLGAIHFALYLKTQHGKKTNKARSYIPLPKEQTHVCFHLCVCVWTVRNIQQAAHTHTHERVTEKHRSHLKRYIQTIHPHTPTHRKQR